MATMVAWRMLDALGAYPNGLDVQANRVKNYGLINLANKGKDRLLYGVTRQQLEGLWGVPNNKIAVRDPFAGAVVSGSMTCAIPTNESAVGFVTATFLQANIGFQMDKRLIGQNGVIGVDYQQELAWKIFEVEKKLATNLEGQIYTALNAAKATTTSSSLVGVGTQYGALVGDTIQVSLTNRPTFFGDVDSIFLADDFQANEFYVIGDAALASTVNYYGNQGGGNNSNTAYQFPNKMFMFSNAISTTASARSTGFIMPPNSLGFYSKIAPEYQNGLELKKGIIYDKHRSDLMGIDLMVMYQDACSDQSAATGNASDTEAPLEGWKFGYKVCILTPYVPSGSTNTGIKKFDILNA